MKDILFTADWHIKLGAKNIPINWSINRYNLFLEQVSKVEDKAGLHIVGGDIFDRLPSLAELSIYFKFVGSCKIPTIIYDGNHEATKKNETFFDSLVQVTASLNPLVSVVTKTIEYEDLTILPYADLHKKDSIEKCNKDKPLFTHVRGEIPPHVKPEVDLDRFNDFPVVFAGDLHSHSNTQRNIVYPGSPMTTSFHRSLVETGYILIENDFSDWKWEPFKLPQLIRKTVSSPDEMVPTDFHHTIYELEGDLQQLSTVANSDLLDKKIVKRDTEVTLNLKDKSLAEELALYLEEVLQLPEDTKEGVLEVFNAHYKGN
jgi:DNA repair exonuclease SbcCD nuclease subunit